MPGPPSVAGGPPWSASRVGRQDGRECTACSGAGNRGHETSPPGRFRRFVVRVLAERGLQPVSQPKPRHVKGRTGRSGPTRYTCSPRGPLAQLGECRRRLTTWIHRAPPSVVCATMPLVSVLPLVPATKALVVLIASTSTACSPRGRRSASRNGSTGDACGYVARDRGSSERGRQSWRVRSMR